MDGPESSPTRSSAGDGSTPPTGAQRVRDELREEGAPEKWAAHRRHPVRAQGIGEGGDERHDPVRFCEERVEVEPQAAVVPRFEPELAAPCLRSPSCS